MTQEKTANEAGRNGTTVRIGTRSSPLALWQAEHVRSLLETGHPGVKIELVRISTAGDRDRNSPLAAVGGMGLFTKEIQRALMDEQVDIAVHSLKDLPTAAPDALTLGAIPPRELAFDSLISPKYRTLQDLPKGARVGTSSLRRKAQLLNIRPDLIVEPIRGNVETRLNRASDADMAAVILAQAGLTRLGLIGHETEALVPPRFLPAVGQGALGIECRVADQRTRQLLAPLNDAPTRAAVLAERHLLRLLEGGCMIPLSAWGRSDAPGRLRLTGRVFSPDGDRMVEAEAEAGIQDPESLGATVAELLLKKGAAELLRMNPTGGRIGTSDAQPGPSPTQ
ncbi:hydroxymethylbilane synthase [bacterium]|nr:hydroxymethylbilane synthase [bacterium]